jgi:dTDP-4-dehydrorhamnose reductase
LRIVVIGANGQLGSDLVRVLPGEVEMWDAT